MRKGLCLLLLIWQSNDDDYCPQSIEPRAAPTRVEEVMFMRGASLCASLLHCTAHITCYTFHTVHTSRRAPMGHTVWSKKHSKKASLNEWWNLAYGNIFCGCKQGAERSVRRAALGLCGDYLHSKRWWRIFLLPLVSPILTCMLLLFWASVMGWGTVTNGLSYCI